MTLIEVKDQVEDLIKKFGEDAEVSFSMYDDGACECFDLDINFDSADKEDDVVVISVNYKSM